MYGKEQKSNGGVNLSIEYKFKFFFCYFLLFFVFISNSRAFNFNRFENYLDVLIELDDVCKQLGGPACGSYKNYGNKWRFGIQNPSNIYKFVEENASKSDYHPEYIKNLLDLYVNAKDYLNICMAVSKDKFKYKDRYEKDDFSYTLMNSSSERSNYDRYYKNKPEYFSEEYKQCSLKPFSKIDLLVNDRNFECMDGIQNLKFDALRLFSSVSYFTSVRKFYDYKLRLLRSKSDLMSGGKNNINKYEKIIKLKLSYETLSSTRKCSSLFKEFVDKMSNLSTSSGSNINNYDKVDENRLLIISDWLPRVCSECDYKKADLKKDLHYMYQEVLAQTEEIQEIEKEMDKILYSSKASQLLDKKHEELFNEKEEKLRIFEKKIDKMKLDGASRDEILSEEQKYNDYRNKLEEELHEAIYKLDKEIFKDYFK